jgi:osmotically-inducible protein OsmY
VKFALHILSLTVLLAGMPAVAVPAAAAQAAATDVAARVKAQIDANAEFKDLGVTVAAAGDVVTLQGVVPSPLVRAKIGELAKGTEGVSKVNNKLTLEKKK